MRNIYVSLTTVKDWRPKISEIDDLGLTELALFPTAIELPERQELYSAIEKTGLKKIPCVHLRDDMERWEIDWLIEKYGAEKFNLHPSKEARAFLATNSDLKHLTYIENLDWLSSVFFELVEEAAGVCLDVSHYEDFGVMQNSQGYEGFAEYLRNHTIGWNHVSAINDELAKNISAVNQGEIVEYNLHTIQRLSQMDYLRGHLEVMSDTVAIELNNSLAEQLKVKKYLESFIK